jgi:hypothetical protein
VIVACPPVKVRGTTNWFTGGRGPSSGANGQNIFIVSILCKRCDSRCDAAYVTNACRNPAGGGETSRPGVPRRG